MPELTLVRRDLFVPRLPSCNASCVSTGDQIDRGPQPAESCRRRRVAGFFFFAAVPERLIAASFSPR